MMSEGMQRSRTQVLFSYLPGSVYLTESGYVAETVWLDGRSADVVNKRVVLAEIENYLSAWSSDDRLGLELPSRLPPDSYRFVTPTMVYWRLWPLAFECARPRCGRIVTFRRPQDVPSAPRCPACNGSLRQLRYVSAHQCSRIVPMFVPPCPDGHGYSAITFEDTGSFLSSVFRCWGDGCGGRVVRRTALSPCTCQPTGQRPDMMRAHTIQDSRLWYPHSVTLINLGSDTYRRLQEHPQRGAIALASYVGLLGSEGHIEPALREVDGHRAQGGARLGQEEWNARETQLRTIGLTESEISAVRVALGPRESWVDGMGGPANGLLDVGAQRTVVERAALYDRDELQRFTLDDIQATLLSRGETTASEAVAHARTFAESLGISELAVTWSFPIALAAFGYTRETRARGEGKVHGFGERGRYDGATPVFTAATETEALLGNLSAARVMKWLHTKGAISGPPLESEAEARRALLELFARKQEDPAPAVLVETLLHTVSHTLLRALGDSSVGISEASLAEWIVPETLTFAIYVSSFRSYTLGTLWTLLSNRGLGWLRNAVADNLVCENDPVCHESRPRACERCLFLAFGCPEFNADLDRGVLREFWANV